MTSTPSAATGPTAWGPAASGPPADPTRRYTVLSFLQWLPVGLMMVPMVLLLLERGLSLGQIAVVVGVSSVSVALLELPTGGLADTLGRKPVLVVSALAHAVALVILGLAAGMALLLFSAVLRGLSRALSTGPLEAWYVDSVQALRPLDDDNTPLTTGLARGEMASSVALAVGTLVGGVLPVGLGLLAERGLTLPVSVLAVPILLAAAVEVVRAALTIGLRDTPRAQEGARISWRSVAATVGAGVRLAGRDRVVLRLLLVAGTTGVALAVLELITPAWLDRMLADPERAAASYAVLVTVGFGADALGAALAPVARSRLASPVRASAVATGVALVGVLGLTVAALLAGSGAVALAAVGYVVFFVGLGAAGPPLGEVLHGQVRSSERATVLSVQSLVLQLAGAAGALLAGVLVTREGMWAGFAIAAVALVGGVHLLIRLSGSGGRESAQPA